MLVGRQGEELMDIESYSGLAWRKPLVGIVMTIFLLSLAGFPFTGGFIGKFFILRSAVENGLLPLAIVLVLTSLVSYWYYLRVAWYMWFRETGTGTGSGTGTGTGTGTGSEAPIVLAGTMKTALVLSAVVIVLLGVFPGALLTLAERSAATLTSTVTSVGLR